jgi:ankyrin repeat protein
MDYIMINEIIKLINEEQKLAFSEISITLDSLLITIDINSLDEKGDSFLHHSVIKQNYEIAEYLLIKGANPNIQSSNGETPITQACRKGNILFVKLLLQYGGNPDIYDNSNDSALLWASYHGHLEIVIFLIENKVDPYHKFKDNRDAIRWAVRENSYQVVEYLSKYLNNILDRDTFGDTIMDVKTTPEITLFLKNFIKKNKLVMIKYFINKQSKLTDFNLVDIIGKYYYSDDD